MERVVFRGFYVRAWAWLVGKEGFDLQKGDGMWEVVFVLRITGGGVPPPEYIAQSGHNARRVI